MATRCSGKEKQRLTLQRRGSDRRGRDRQCQGKVERRDEMRRLGTDMCSSGMERKGRATIWIISDTNSKGEEKRNREERSKGIEQIESEC